MFNLTGKVAVVTGGAQGMGRMIANGLIEAGARVYITSRKADICEAAAREMGERCSEVVADLSHPEGTMVCAETLCRLESKIHILVNNAGKTWGASFETFPEKAWNAVMAVNVQTPFILTQQLLQPLKAAATAQDPSRVINIGSLAGHVVERLNAFSYAASKAALHHLSKELAAQLASENITVNTIAPGYFPTNMTAHIRADEEEHAALSGRIPLGRLGTASDIAGTCIFLASGAASYITGVTIPLDGGLSGCGAVDRL